MSGKKIFLIILFVFLFLSSTKNVFALAYDLIPPSGNLSRGQEVEFTINIDTQGQNVTSGAIGMTFDTQYLQYIETTAGSAMNSISASTVETTKIMINGTSSSGFSGTGVFAYVKFKIIAASPGSTELCILWQPSGTPAPPAVTQPPQVTRLPASGNMEATALASIAGVSAVAVAGLFYFVIPNLPHKRKSQIKKEHKHIGHSGKQ